MSEPITAEEYRIAAKVAAQSGGFEMPAAAEAWEKRADMLDTRDKHFKALGYVTVDANHDYLVRGMRIADWLRDNGWTPPEGLF